MFRRMNFFGVLNKEAKMYKLSIIIPTKNRQFYCKSAIEQFRALNLRNTQLIVQDNSDDDELRTFIADLNDTRIKYNYHPGVLSFVDNFSEAIALADGEYLCMIGDDDGVLPYIEKVVDNMSSTYNCDAIIPGLNAVYCWPSQEPIFKNAETGYLCLSYIKDKVTKINPLNGLHKLIKRGGMDYQECGIPRLYHGIVRKSILDNIKNITGKYFGGLTPDIYIAVALSLTCQNVYKVKFPVTVSGICPRSGSSDSATGRHTGKLEDAPHFNGHKEYIWDLKAPKIYSVETIWGETLLQALNDFKAEKFYEEFSVKYLDSLCYMKYPQFRDEIIAHAKKYGISEWKIKIKALNLKILPLFNKYIRRIIRRKSNVLKYYTIENINKAVEITADITNKKIII